ncbi:MAG TPA: 1-deoxy-D-xylulose-5-phosphate synthase [Lachnospiraceae bacterium]|nr:1-deoxy-D-xylulose-5-phosphate synthase [Lachnospiraceae bacterium]
MVLEKINHANDIKKIPKEELPVLAQEIRSFLIEKLSATGGHLASNLGVIELTMALHLTLTLPADKIIWDVGHQSYTHKILTGRRDGFDSLRKLGGLSGFPKREESPCDVFDTGHSSTSISAALGIARARDLAGEDYHVVAVIGDGSFTGGMVYEALNNASQMKTNFIIILNDNGMSISENVGGFSSYLSSLRTNEAYTSLKKAAEDVLRHSGGGESAIRRIRGMKNNLKSILLPGAFFEELGIKYFGPIDGYNLDRCVTVFQNAQKVEGPVIVHVLTKKGKGYEPAERMPARFHGTGPFKIDTGLPARKKAKADWSDIFSTVMCKEGKRTPNLCAVTAAMPDGTGLKRFRGMYPDRFFDVGIAEAHAVTFSAGLAVGGMIPVFAVYSSFLQRGFDQIVHDVCLQNLHVIFAIDRGGLVGADGETHQGIFDLSYLSMIPNMTVVAPKNKWELADLLKWAIRKAESPVAIRYPRGSAFDGLEEFRAPVRYGEWEILYDESDICLLATGSMVQTALEVRARLKKEGANCTLINCRFIKPLDEAVLREAAGSHNLLVTMEENVLAGGFGSLVLECLNQFGEDVPVECVALPDAYIEAGSVELLKAETALDAESIYKRIRTRMIGLYA